MANSNLIAISFTAEEVQSIREHMSAIRELLGSKCISLTAEERREHGRIGNKTENWSRKVMQYMNEQPGFNPTFIDAEETQRDFEARETLKPIFNELQALQDMVDDTMLILGSDLYQANLSYYQNVRLMAAQNVNGAKAIYDDLAAQFPRNGRKKKAE
ncbi:hypothetical protein KDU71_09225 [Carboxylicivirga sediminis]|uniref:Uncharacterized protein n=1 Tax=Carboxylicivirga sediminis TaxID=2006564 RepID=A0A941F4V2_9BACT|nr:hypothetical protein [Carboxylicivirga sediminis]MBR8535735.1 hypothetical protein [Carboxylicivirga sediminis]